MQLTRTTIRLYTPLKKAAEKMALEQDTTFQEILNKALDEFLKKSNTKKAEKLTFQTFNLGANLDNLTRDDFYD